MRQLPAHRVTGHALAAAPPAPVVRLHDPARQHGPVRLEQLAGDLQTEAVEAGELLPAGEGRYYSRSYSKDTARSEERTIVATNDEKDKGVYNNWRPAAEMKEKLTELMRGQSQGKTMYVLPYLMSPKGNELAQWATGVELTESMAMWPGASVSGLYIGHPDAYYFGVAKVEADQVEDYAARKGMSLAEAERWLAPVLNYLPGRVVAAE
mgnify:CR=1 FL=1